MLTSTHGGYNLLVGNGPDAAGQHETADMSVFSDTSEMTVYRESIRLTLEHVMDHPLSWFKLLPSKFYYLWASDADWVTFARAFNLRVFHDQFQQWLPSLKWFYPAVLDGDRSDGGRGGVNEVATLLVQLSSQHLSLPHRVLDGIPHGFLWHGEVSCSGHSGYCYCCRPSAVAGS